MKHRYHRTDPTGTSGDRTTAEPGRARTGLRVSTVLLLVAIVPLCGIALVTVSSVRHAQRTAEAAASTETWARRALTASRVEAAVADEMVHAVDVALAGPSGTDLPDAIARTDRLLDEAHAQSLVDALSEARSAGPDPSRSLSAYTAARTAAVGTTDRALEELLWSITAANHDGRLLENALGLIYLIDTGRAIAEQFAASVALNTHVRGAPTEELARLIEQRGRVTTNLGWLMPLAQTATVLRPRSTSPGLEQAFEDLAASMERTIEAALSTPLAPRAPALGSDVTADATVRLTELRTITTGASTATGAMLDALTSIVLAETETVRDRAERDAFRSYALALALTLATITTALAAARFIVRPIRRLEQAADALRDGLAATTTSPAGPSEIRAAAGAIGEAALHLELVTQQAFALAEGELDAEILERHDPTGLGAALQLAVATLRAALVTQDELRHQLAHEATHDDLTGLPNRRASLARLNSSLARTRRTGTEVAVLFLDLDHFKAINDTYGHRTGDLVLSTMARRLITAVRAGDHVGRLGGDEFIVIAEPVEGTTEATVLAQRILDACTEPVQLDDLEFRVGLSIGLALSGPTTGPDAEDVIHHADLALYRAKTSGRGTVAV